MSVDNSFGVPGDDQKSRSTSSSDKMELDDISLGSIAGRASREPERKGFWNSINLFRNLRLGPRIFVANSGLLILAILAISLSLLYNQSAALRDLTSDNGEQLARLIAEKYGDIGEISIANVATTVDEILNDPMIAQAAIAAYLVQAAASADYDTSAVIDILTSIVAETVLDEFWITDDTAFSYLTNVRFNGELVPFAFNPDPSVQPQASIFYPLVEVSPDSFAVVTQPAQVREIDRAVYKYVAVNGVDQRRIVQIGNELVFGNQELLRQDHATDRHDVSGVIEGNLGQHMIAQGTMLDQFVEAAEVANWDADSIETVFSTLVDRTTIGEIRVADTDGNIIYSSLPDDAGNLLPEINALRTLDLTSTTQIDHPSARYSDDGALYKYTTVARPHGKRLIQVGVAIESATGSVLYTVYQAEANGLVRNGYPQALWVVNDQGELAAASQNTPLQFLGDGNLSAFAAFDVLMSEEESEGKSIFVAAMDSNNVEVVRSARLGLYDPSVRGAWVASPVTVGNERIGGILFYINMDEITENVWGEARQTGLIAILLLLFTALGTFFGARLLTRPIETIATAARMVESGERLDYDLVRTVTKRTDEIGSLARVFEDMAVQVFNREEVLETLVSERTQELQATNDQLRDAQTAITRDLEMAKVVQAALVREGTHHFDSISVCARMEPALRVGGDFVDFLDLGKGQLFVVVGDVSGKGVASALFMAASQAALKYAVTGGIGSISEVANEANRRLCSQNPMGLFVTVIMAYVDLESGRVEYVSAGHEMPYHLDASGSRCTLPSTFGLAMGVLDDFEYESQTYDLGPGEALVLYSDGLTDMVNLDGELFGKDRLEESIDAVSSRKPDAIVNDVWGDIHTFSAGTQPADDMTCLVLSKTLNGEFSTEA